MKATLPWLCAMFVAVAATSLVQADSPYYYYPRVPQAPDACGTGYFCSNACGMVYGPNYCVRPPFPPFNGIRPCMSELQQNQVPGFPVRPFVRSPRDYFMVEW